jgi:hypothetical protein
MEGCVLRPEAMATRPMKGGMLEDVEGARRGRGGTLGRERRSGEDDDAKARRPVKLRRERQRESARLHARTLSVSS